MICGMINIVLNWENWSEVVPTISLIDSLLKTRRIIGRIIRCFFLIAVISVSHGTILEHPPVATSVIGPVYSQYISTPKGDFRYSATDVEGPHGALKQQTAVGKDALGGHSIRHSAQATHVDPHSGEAAVKHDEHAFHINPFYGQAEVHTNNAEGSLNHAIGAATFAQKTHDAKLAPGHASILDTANTAAVSPVGNAASQDVLSARTDVLLDGVAQSAHTAHRSYAQGPAIGGVSRAASTTSNRFDGAGYGNLHYNTQQANHAYDPYGHTSAEEAGYDLKQAYDARVGLGATNELEYSRHAARDPYGNYGAVSQAKQTSHGGHLVPAYAAVYKQPIVYETAPYVAPKAVAYAAAPAAYTHVAPAHYYYR